MAFLDEIGALIEASSAYSTSWPVYRSHLPDSTVLDDRAIGLIHAVGGGSMERVDLQEDMLTILVRGRSVTSVSTAYQEAEAKALEVKNAVRGYAGSAVSNSVHYAGIWSVSGTYFQGFDESWRPVMRSDMRCVRVS